VSPTDVSPTENSWMLRPLNKTSLKYCVTDQCVPNLDRVKHETSSVGRYRGLGRPPAPNESVGRLAGFAYAPDQVSFLAPLRRMHARPTHRTPPPRSAKERGSWKSGVASLNQIKGMGWFGQGQNSQGTLCSRDATSKNFRSGTHRSGMD
jgi:hypothetical protein